MICDSWSTSSPIISSSVISSTILSSPSWDIFQSGSVIGKVSCSHLVSTYGCQLDIGDVLEGPRLQTGGVGWPGYTGFVYLSRSWFCPGRVFEGAAHIPLCLDALIFYSPLEGTLCVMWRTRVQNSVSGF
ncbi:hypothetical protein Nepgr_033961 [Nepenthes gracilis]|uniref:Uncharacterized protein n=1 Tax=Nepenthes gracilis TaxID=150966 RepID=A0AAD3TN72_NEPGR|nr:hypothetical protein Nepgr_033961 [Nepenthes gracilis]